jgi:hypothetical protein
MYVFLSPHIHALQRIMEYIRSSEKQVYDSAANWSVHPDDRFLGGICYPPPSQLLLSYRPEWIIQGLILVVYLSISLGGKAPGCPRGYLGPGGLAEGGKYAGWMLLCTA